MLQRIQTVYLLVASILLFLTIVMGFASYSWGENQVIFSIIGLTENPLEVNTWFPYKIVVPLIAAMCLFSIVQFKKRKLQLTIGRIVILLLVVLITFVFIDLYTIAAKLVDADVAVLMETGYGMYLPVAALPLVFLANRAINKDEKLIKSVDRLRG
ncbi:MAG: hypothetical protein ACI9J3_000979 [Parvicellaceae bacterium]|jgi:hypothetical protein